MKYQIADPLPVIVCQPSEHEVLLSRKYM